MGILPFNYILMDYILRNHCLNFSYEELVQFYYVWFLRSYMGMVRATRIEGEILPECQQIRKMHS